MLVFSNVLYSNIIRKMKKVLAGNPLSEHISMLLYLGFFFDSCMFKEGKEKRYQGKELLE